MKANGPKAYTNKTLSKYFERQKRLSDGLAAGPMPMPSMKPPKRFEISQRGQGLLSLAKMKRPILIIR